MASSGNTEHAEGGNSENKAAVGDKYAAQRIIWNGHTITSMRKSISHGASLTGAHLPTLMSFQKYGIVCGIEISNWTRYNLTEPESTIKSGYISSPAVSTKPGEREAMITHKKGYTPTGSSGVVSWLIKEKCRRIVVLWSSPFYGNNTIAVGLTKEGTEIHDKEWFKTITEEKNDKKLEYTISTFGSSCKEIIAEDASFQVCGTMGTSSKPEIKIILRPKDWENLFTVKTT